MSQNQSLNHKTIKTSGNTPLSGFSIILLVTKQSETNLNDTK